MDSQYQVRLTLAREEIDACLAELADTTTGVVETEDGLTAYFHTREAAALWGDPVEVATEDWSRNWQQSWQPFALGERWYLAPPWDESSTPPGRVRLTMVPGNIFGGGDHPTTQMCLELLEQAVVPGERVLDIGTGTGILAVAAQALGARVFACDIDLEAVRTAKTSGNITVWQGAPESCRPSCADVVLANLPGGLLLDLLPALRRLAPVLLVSGYLDGQAPLVEANAQVHARLFRDGWHAALLRYPERKTTFMSAPRETAPYCSETVEAQGHLIDSHIMEQIFDTVVEYQGRFEVEHFHIGRTNGDPSQLRLRVEAPTQAQMDLILSQLLGLGATPIDAGDAELATIERDRCAPEDFYSTTNHRTMVRQNQQWIDVEKQRMDALVVIQEDGTAYCRKLRDIKAGDRVVVGMRGIRVIPESKERDRSAFAFMSNGISSERQVETAVRQTVEMVRQTREQGRKIVIVAGPVVVHTGGVQPLSALIRAGYVDALLAGNALGVHDIEADVMGTSLGLRMSDGRQEEHGHRNHMRAINRINWSGGIANAVHDGTLKSGIMYECVKANVPFVLAGSLRDDGPLPDTITDMNQAQEAYNQLLQGAGLVLCLASMLHSIAVGNMLPGWVKTVCVDINPAVATKLSDRGTGQAVGIVTDVGLFLDHLAKGLLS